MRQGQRANRPLFIGYCRHFRRVPFRATNQECQVTALRTPVFQTLRQLLGTELTARHIQRDDIRILR
ncbi:hypothetical protein D3C81_1682940 [compost metagenome]